MRTVGAVKKGKVFAPIDDYKGNSKQISPGYKRRAPDTKPKKAKNADDEPITGDE